MDNTSFNKVRADFLEYLKANNITNDDELTTKDILEKYNEQFKLFITDTDIGDKFTKNNDIKYDEKNKTQLDSMLDSYIEGVDKNSNFFKAIDTDKNGEISTQEKTNFYNKVKSLDGKNDDITFADIARAAKGLADGDQNVMNLFTQATGGGQNAGGGGGGTADTTTTPPSTTTTSPTTTTAPSATTDIGSGKLSQDDVDKAKEAKEKAEEAVKQATADKETAHEKWQEALQAQRVAKRNEQKAKDEEKKAEEEKKKAEEEKNEARKEYSIIKAIEPNEDGSYTLPNNGGTVDETQYNNMLAVASYKFESAKGKLTAAQGNLSTAQDNKATAIGISSEAMAAVNSAHSAFEAAKTTESGLITAYNELNATYETTKSNFEAQQAEEAARKDLQDLQYGHYRYAQGADGKLHTQHAQVEYDDVENQTGVHVNWVWDTYNDDQENRNEVPAKNEKQEQENEFASELERHKPEKPGGEETSLY